MFPQHDVGGQGGDLTTLFQPVSVTVTTVRDFGSCCIISLWQSDLHGSRMRVTIPMNWSLVERGSTTDSLIHGCGEFQCINEKRKLEKSCILKAETRVRTGSMVLEARAGTLPFLTGICARVARSFCGRSEMNQILLWCKNEVGNEQGLTNGV